jgi:hypothetical protein
MGEHVNDQALIKADALNRAVRTLWQGFGFDAVAAIGAGTLILANDIPVESALFWQSFGALALKSVVVSAASYMARLKLAPKTPTTGE